MNWGIEWRSLNGLSPLSMTPSIQSSHTLFEDAQALLVGTLFVALAVMMFKQAGVLTGGTAGLAFLIHYVFNWQFGVVFFILNLPFYVFAWRAMGKVFVIKTFLAVSMLSLYTEWLPNWISFSGTNMWFAAVIGGLLAGAGILMLARHKSSLGGIGVLALYMQEKHGWRAGKMQMAVDVLILLSGIAVLPTPRLLASVLGAIALNMVIAVNHRPGRYTGM